MSAAAGALPAFSWYAVRTRSNHETIASEWLTARKVEAFLPALDVPSARRDRHVTLHKALFPGYFFVRSIMTGAARIEVLKAPGVVSVVGFESGPVPVPDWQIQSIQIALASRDHVDILWKLVPGRRVRVTRGSLAGAEGVVITPPAGDRRLAISLDLLGRSLAVKLTTNDIEPVD